MYIKNQSRDACVETDISFGCVDTCEREMRNTVQRSTDHPFIEW